MSSDPDMRPPLGRHLANRIATLAASSAAQVAMLAVYALWFSQHWDLNWLMTILAIVSLTLTQMVLKRQLARESDDRRRDVALHAKLDELILAKTGARDEMAGIESLDEEAITELRDNAQQQVESLDEELADREPGPDSGPRTPGHGHRPLAPGP